MIRDNKIIVNINFNNLLNAQYFFKKMKIYSATQDQPLSGSSIILALLR